ncbi:hypothetical protein BCR32DRAFT_284675 [Anaeromyces robustus]|uniref:Late endosomal/lysosomal adaptor and MAPK and MTOR activator 5 n=1 Tax=Anaeromyces robustus TaxID=1754192 RepID=A0A1Y1WR30_9FUNG|nr:hypothetical protein BCR32DRAFT_284675 [Anaeromyces robustus]|eukprot:ORX75989.1 hypothetical protein BCR32DRAFT_284675 [Anaeromyces robustus]
MENQFENTIQKYSSMENVKGILVTDNNGLCLGSKGNIKSNSAAYVSSLINRATEISLDSSKPIISIDTDNTNFLISSENDITVALAKQKMNN